MNVKNTLLCILAAVFLALSLQSLGEVGSRDSIAYWSAIQAFMRGENPYDLTTLLDIQRSVDPLRQSPQLFLNPPWAIPLLLPIFCWDFTTSSFLLLAGNIAITFLTLRKLGELFAPMAPRYLVIVGAFLPIASCWYFGQLSCFIMLGAILSLEWIVHTYRPWWKLGGALILFSIKPQTPYLVAIALMLTMLRYGSRGDLCKVALLALVPASFLAYHQELLIWWFRSFTHSSQWATSSLPSLAYSTVSFVNRPAVLIVPALILSLLVIAFERRALTPHRFLTYMIISALTAPYAWVFDFAPLVLVTYTIALIAVRESTSSFVRLAYFVALGALCLPFETLFTNNLQAYTLHPLIVATLFFASRGKANELFERNGGN